jgi:hypothetical protein
MTIAVVLAATAVGSHASQADCRPETWFHVIGGNASKAGLTADLEALKAAGVGGIQFFHGQFGGVQAWDGVGEQIPCLSEKWDDFVVHAADECARLGLSFKMQNCPGWSMSGGPWIAPSNAMRKLAYAQHDVRKNEKAPRSTCYVPADIPIPASCRDVDSDWHDLFYIAFPTPEGSCTNDVLTPAALETIGGAGPTNTLVRLCRFSTPVTIRTLELPPPRALNSKLTYRPQTRVRFEAQTPDGWQTACDTAYPQGCWQDSLPFSLACAETTAEHWRLTLTAPHNINLPYVRFRSGARLDNWEGLAGHVLRGQLKRPSPAQSAAAYIPANAVRIVRPGEPLPPSDSGWTVLRVGHVNMKIKNHPAPKEATGWECDKLDPRGIEANFAGYIGRLVDGPLKGGKLKGIIVDSWECQRQNWTWRLAEEFRAENGYEVWKILPAVFGWVIDSPAETEKRLLDWRRTVSGLITKNYYGRLAELAHAKGLTVAYETAFGDVLPGDILEYWKWCDTPMCEFWQPYTPTGVGSPNYKPVRPCVSAAHLYGKRRVDCESFTSMALTWDENFRDLKEQAVRHFAHGVTHLVFHTMTHNPQTDGRRPGTSFGSYIGTPFIRGQTWWPFLRSFTDWAAACCAFLERGLPVVDALRYLGDELDHKPNEEELFPEGFKNDYLNRDALFNRLDVVKGRFVLPDGMSYSVIWVPDSVLVLPATRARLDALAAKGGRIVYGSMEDAVAGLSPQIVCSPAADRGTLLWYHRIDGDTDCFFVAGDAKGYAGEVRFRTQQGERKRTLDLAPYETRLLEFTAENADDVENIASAPSADTAAHRIALTDWTLSFPSGWDAPARMTLNHLVPWKDMPNVSAEGRAFSGTAVYETAFELPSAPTGTLWLDLGKAHDFAHVFVNGQEVARLWSLPYACEIGRFAKAGRNEVRIEVTSTWFNRLAYDFGQPPEKRKTWTIWKIGGNPPPCLKPQAPLRVSGLLGPVAVYGNHDDN